MTLKITWFQHTCHKQGHLLLDQVAQSSSQPGLGHCKGQDMHNFSGQMIPMLYYPHRKNFFLIFNLNPPSCSWKPLSLVPLKHTLAKSHTPIFLQAIFRYWKTALKSSQNLLFPSLNNLSSISFSTQERCCSPLISFTGPYRYMYINAYIYTPLFLGRGVGTTQQMLITFC